MPRKLKVAAIQMIATPAPVTERLERAADLIAEAASSGAQLVVLPEVFNTGYEYSETNYTLAEPIDGQTVTWMSEQAAQHHVYLAGTLMLRDEEDVFNTALLIAPDGRTWRYDKNYPFLWERSYFRDGQGITIADTELGKFGMMICWDSAHPDLWQRYAGKVDAMIIPSCPPELPKATFKFPDGAELHSPNPDENHFADQDIHDQAAWMRVPVVHTSGGGTFRSTVPAPLFSALGLAPTSSELRERLSEAHEAVLETGYGQKTKIIDATGEIVARVEHEGEGFTMAEVELADEPPRPGYDQPEMRTSPGIYFMADVAGPAMMMPGYRKGVRRQWGARMAPVEFRTKVWTVVTALALVVGWLVGKVTTRR